MKKIEKKDCNSNLKIQSKYSKSTKYALLLL